jgi:hypothetical protein
MSILERIINLVMGLLAFSAAVLFYAIVLSFREKP